MALGRIIISLGIMVYKNAKGTINDANLSEHEIQVYNDKFASFLETNTTVDDVTNRYYC